MLKREIGESEVIANWVFVTFVVFGFCCYYYEE